MIAEVDSIENTFWKKDKSDKVYFCFSDLFSAEKYADFLAPAKNLQCILSSFSILHPSEHAPSGLLCVFGRLAWNWCINTFVSAIFWEVVGLQPSSLPPENPYLHQTHPSHSLPQIRLLEPNWHRTMIWDGEKRFLVLQLRIHNTSFRN